MVSTLRKPPYEFSERQQLVCGKPSSASTAVLIPFPWLDLPCRKRYGICSDAKSRTCTGCHRDLPIENYYSKGAERRESQCKECALKAKSSAYRKKKSAARKRNVIEIDGSNIREVNLMAATVESSSLEGLLRDLMLDVVLDTREEMGVRG